MSSNQPSSSSSSARPPSATGAGRSGSSGQQHFGHPPHPPPPQGYEYRYEYPPPPQGYVYQTGPPPLARPGLQPPGSYGGPHPAGYAPPPGSPMPAAPYPPPAAVVQAASSDKSKKHSHSQSHAHSHHSHSHSQSRRSQSGPSSSDHRPAGDRISASSSTAANAGHVGAKEQSQEGKAFKVLEETTEATSPTIRFTGTVPTSPLTTRQSPLTSAQRRTKKAGKSKHRSRRTDGAAAAAGEGAAALAATAASASAPGVVVAGSPQQQGQQSSPSPAGASPAALMAMAATASAGSVARNNDGLGAKGGAQMGAGTTGKERGADETTAVIAAGGDIATVGSDKYSSLLSRYAAQSERLQQIRAAQQAREQQQQQQGWLEREVAKTAATLRQQQMSQQMSQQVALGSLFSLEQARIRRAQQLAQVAALQSGAAAAAFAAAGMVPGIAQQTLTNAAAAPSTVAGGIAGSVARGGATVAKADTTTARDAAPKENVAKGTANERDVAGILGSLATVDASKKRSREDSVDVNEKNKTKKSRKETHTSREKEITVALDSDSDDGVVQTLDDDDDDFDDEHKVLQTPLAGPYVRGFLNKDSWTVAEIKEQSGMGKGYFKNQIVRIGTFGTCSNEGTFSLTAANINSITARLDEDIRKVVSRSVGVAEEEMRRNHSAIVSNMETRCKRLEKELDAEKLKVRNVTVASRKSSNNPDDHIKEMDRAKQRLKEAEEGYKTALSAQKVEHGDMLAKAKEENDKKLEKLMEDEKKKARSLKEKINALQAELEETKTNHARSLKMYLEASSNALRLVRKDERRGLL